MLICLSIEFVMSLQFWEIAFPSLSLKYIILWYESWKSEGKMDRSSYQQQEKEGVLIVFHSKDTNTFVVWAAHSLLFSIDIHASYLS